MITTVTGANSFLIKQYLREEIDKFVGQFGDLAVERFDAGEVECQKIMDAISSLPFLATNKLIIVDSAVDNKQFVENIDTLPNAVPDSTHLIIVAPKIDKRAKYAKVLQKHTNYKEFNDLDEQGLARWLVELADQRGGKLSVSDARFLVDRIGINQMLLQNELSKLLSYSPSVTRSSIELLSEPLPQTNVFQLLDAAFAGHTKRTLDVYEDQRRQGVEPLAILAMLAWQLHALATVKVAGQKTVEEIAKASKLNPYVVRKTKQIADKRSLAEVKKCVRRAHLLDIAIKSTSIDSDEALKQFLIEL